ncbi:MAG: hypothetical protein ACT4QD_17650 [Acidobacteriota bacterium]
MQDAAAIRRNAGVFITCGVEGINPAGESVACTRLPVGRRHRGHARRTPPATGFAAAPGLLQVFAAFPMMTTPVLALCWAWMPAAMVTGVRHALDDEHTSRALAVCGVAALLIRPLAAHT